MICLYKLQTLCFQPSKPSASTHLHSQTCIQTRAGLSLHASGIKITSRLRALFWRLSVNSGVRDTLQMLNTANTTQQHYRAAGWSYVVSAKHPPFAKAGGLRAQLENFGHQCFRKWHNRHTGQDLTRVTWYYTMSFFQENYKMNYLVLKADFCTDNIFISSWWPAVFTTK
jgi:hypothetical protein